MAMVEDGGAGAEASWRVDAKSRTRRARRERSERAGAQRTR